MTAGSLGMAMLEVIDKGLATELHPIPLLFVHGGAHSAWCWDEHFLDFFAYKGYRAVALSFRGHGGSAISTPLNSCSIADYVDDVSQVVDQLATMPVLVGHSMGGFVVQKFLESRTAPAAVLMASVPPRSYSATHLRTALRYPWPVMKVTLNRDPVKIYNGPARVREILFSKQTPEATVEKCYSRLDAESFRVMGVDMALLHRVRPERVKTPLLVLGGEHDGHFNQKAFRDTARAYNTAPEIFPQMGHNMMLEPGWQAVAERIDGWLASQGL